MFEYQKYLDQLRDRKKEIEGEVDAKNPFDSGVMRAVKSAKISLGLDTDQEHKAIRKGIFRFADALTQQYGDPRYSKRKGAINNLASVAPAMAKGLEGYEDASDKIQHDNREVYEFAKKFRDAEVKRLRDLDQEAFDRYFADKKLGLEEAKLAEQRDYHKSKTKNLSNLESDFIPYANVNESKPYKKAKGEFGTSLSKIKEIKSKYNNFRYKYKENIADPMGPLSLITNPTKDFVGKYGNSKVLRDETSDRKALNSMLNEFIIQNENALRGGGVLGPRLIEVFKNLNIYPSLDRDTPEDFIKKLDRMEEETQKYYDTANHSLKYGIHLDPYDLEGFKSRYLSNEEEIADITPQTGGEINNNIKFIRLYDPDSNKYFNIPANDYSQVMLDYPNLVMK